MPLSVGDSPGIERETISTPGAWISTQLPLLEKSASLLTRSTAPTVKASGDLAGENVHELLRRSNCPLFPAAATTKIPSATARATAESIAGSDSNAMPPRLMLRTARLPAGLSPIAQSIAAIIPAVLPLPPQFKTLRARMDACFATPYVALATVPATWVPWPSQSAGFVSSGMKLTPDSRREPHSEEFAGG